MTILDHTTAAELLFASHQDPTSARDAVRAIVHEYRLHPDLAQAAAQLADEYGDHPHAAAARMARCRALAPGRIELPDSLTPAIAALLGCYQPDCTSDGPLELVGTRLSCPDHHAQALTTAHHTVPGDDDDYDY